MLGMLRIGSALELERDCVLSPLAMGWLAWHPAGADREVVLELRSGWVRLREAHPELPETLLMPRDLFIDELDAEALQAHLAAAADGTGMDGSTVEGTADLPAASERREAPTVTTADGERDGAQMPDSVEADLDVTVGTHMVEIDDAPTKEATADLGADRMIDGAADAAAAWLADSTARAEDLAVELEVAAEQLRAGILPTNLDGPRKPAEPVRPAASDIVDR